MASTDSRLSAVAALVAAVLTLLFAAAPALAQEGSLRDFLFPDKPESQRRPPPPTVARYVSETGESFVLDRTETTRPLLRFENSNEVWVLQPSIGPRGDILYKNDLGQVLLRATRMGGLTLFTGKRPGGAAAELAGPGTPIRMKVIGPVEVLKVLLAASARTSRIAGHRVAFDAEATPASSTLIADAAILTVNAIERLAKRPDGPAVLARIQRVLIIEGERPGAVVRNGTLLVVVAPNMGVAGRPSSERIAFVSLR